MSDLERRALLGVAGLGALAAMSKAGPLTPPAGAVSATGKTLDQVEPRRIVDSTGASGTLTLPRGSYKCVNDIQGSSATYQIAGAPVDIDLCGFDVRGGSTIAAINNGFSSTFGIIRLHNGTVSAGIFTASPVIPTRVVLENLTFFNAGAIVLGDGCVVRNCSFFGTSLTLGSTCRVESCTFKSETGTGDFSGLTLGDNSVLRDVTYINANNNGVGVTVGANCTVHRCSFRTNNSRPLVCGERCSISECSAATGAFNASACYVVGVGSTISHCVALGTQAATIGFDLGNQCTAESCTARNGGEGFVCREDNILRDCLAYGGSLRGFAVVGAGCVIEACAARSNAGRGFDLANSCRIERCIAVANTGGGYAFTSDTLVRGNHADSNSTFGMLVTGSDNRIESNSITDSAVGFQIDGTGNLFISNSAAGAVTSPFIIAAGNAAGPIVATAGVATNTVTTANFSY